MNRGYYGQSLVTTFGRLITIILPYFYYKYHGKTLVRLVTPVYGFIIKTINSKYPGYNKTKQ